MKLVWGDHLSVGNALIDSEHKNLLVVLNRIENAIKSWDRIALSSAYELLDTYMYIHTQNEEKIAEAIKYPFAQDKIALQQLMDEMGYMIHKLELSTSVWPDNILKMYSRFLAKWMNEHIVKINMQMKPALQPYLYDFIPGKNTDNPVIQTAMILPIRSYLEPSQQRL